MHTEYTTKVSEDELTPRELVADVFAKWEAGDSSGFFDAVADDVTWTAIGTTPISASRTARRST